MADALSVVVAAQRSDAVGGWALGSLAEVEVYGHLLGEACERLIVPGSALNVTPDGGRYPRARLAELRITLQERLRAKDAGRMNIEFASSAATPGVQVADVIANTVYRLHATGHTTEEVATLQAMLTPLQSSGRLSLHDLELPGVRPGWADQQKGRPKAAYVGVSTSLR